MKISLLESVLHNHLNAHLNGVSRSWTDNLVGYTGIGKTYLVKHLATENDCILISVSISEMEPGDLVGTPHPVQIRPNVYMQMYALPNWLPHIRVDEEGNEVYKTFEDGITRPLLDIDLLGAKVENRKELQAKWGDDWKEQVKGCVIFLDEINRAVDDEMKNAIFEFVEKGRIHTYEAPWNTYRISAMNPPNNNYIVNEMTEEKAFMDRFISYIVESSTEEWLQWAEKRGIHQLIRDFIASDPKALMEDEEPIVLNVRRSPRSYEMLSVLMNETDFPTNKLVRREIYHGVIGKDFGNNFARHEERAFERIPSPEEILNQYASVQQHLKDMHKNRNDFSNMVHQYMLAFLMSEHNARRVFGEAGENPTTEQAKALSNLHAFIMDMPAHSKSLFVRKITDYEHMNLLLGENDDLFLSLLEANQKAFEAN